MTTTLWRNWCWRVAAILFFAAESLSQGADAKSAAAQPPTRPDADYYMQGEYSGTVSDNGQATTIGLQVIALGNGKFSATHYVGGLPGNGWDQTERQRYIGGRVSPQEAKVTTADGTTIVIRPTTAVIYDELGKELGRLQKIIRRSPTMGLPAPADAEVLFAGRDARLFTLGTVTPDHFLVAGADTKASYGDFTMLLEFRTPYMPEARDQARGNSGVYIQGRYEVQILDSFGLTGENNECGGLYKQRAPLQNLCLPPLVWQTYDIDFTAPKFDADGRKTKNARITVRHNGFVIHNDVEITAKTGGGAQEANDPRPLRLQDHGIPVHFRNVWIAPLHSLRNSSTPAADSVCLPCRQ